MKYKKYLLALFIFLFIGCNKAYADNDICYYLGEGFAAQYDRNSHFVYVDVSGTKNLKSSNREAILNWNVNKKIRDYTVPAYTSTDKCPTYLLLWSDKNFIHQYHTYAIDSQDTANAAKNDIERKKNHFSYYATLQPNMTEENYYLQKTNSIKTNKHTNFYDNTEINEQDCKELFGDKNTEGTVAYYINEILKYVRVIVPILIIALGTLDLAKAVMAGKPDEMQKAQKTFIRRLIAGVAVFFVPLIINILMWLADLAWEGLGFSTCNAPF